LKTIFLIITLLISNSLFSAKTYDLLIKTEDAYTKEPIQGILVEIWSNEILLISNLTNENGTVIFRELNARELVIKIVDELDLFKEKTYRLSNKKLSNDKLTFALHPSVKANKLLWLKEDSLYGKANADDSLFFLNSKEKMLACDVDSFPEAMYVGGYTAMMRYIVENVQYPQESVENDEQGRVYIQFIVEGNGKISHVKVEKGAYPSLDEEAVRVIRMMPDWIPAKCGEYGLRQSMRIPIIFDMM